MKHKYPPPEGWFACNIEDIRVYIKQMREQVCLSEMVGELTPERLKAAIDEDSFGEISLQECRTLLKGE